MGTSNFYYKNARALYPLFTGMDEDEAEMFDYTEEVQNIAEHIDELFSLDIVENERMDDDRNFPSRSLGRKTIGKYFGDVSVGVRITIIIRAGYYEGACLDYEIDFMDVDTYDSVDAVQNWFEYNVSDMNAGMCAIQERNARKWLSDQADKMADDIEAVFAKIATPYRLVGRASNGETFYEKA
jgi:hypothetical protein